jgi:hypothetical protein
MKRCAHRSIALYILGILILPFLLSTALAEESETRTLKPFDSIKVSGRMKVYLSEGSSESVTIKVENDDPDKINTEVEGKSLEIKPKTTSVIDEDTEFKIYVTYTELRILRIGGKTKLQGDSVIKGDKLEIDVGNSAIAEMDVDVNVLTCSVSGAGELTVTGKTDDLTCEVNTTGVLNAFELSSANAYVKLGTRGIAEIYATELIEGSVKTTAILTFKGDPKKQRVQRSTGGKIKEL